MVREKTAISAILRFCHSRVRRALLSLQHSPAHDFQPRILEDQSLSSDFVELDNRTRVLADFRDICNPPQAKLWVADELPAGELRLRARERVRLRNGWRLHRRRQFRPSRCGR